MPLRNAGKKGGMRYSTLLLFLSLSEETPERWLNLFFPFHKSTRTTENPLIPTFSFHRY